MSAIPHDRPSSSEWRDCSQGMIWNGQNLRGDPAAERVGRPHELPSRWLWLLPPEVAVVAEGCEVDRACAACLLSGGHGICNPAAAAAIPCRSLHEAATRARARPSARAPQSPRYETSCGDRRRALVAERDRHAGPPSFPPCRFGAHENWLGHGRIRTQTTRYVYALCVWPGLRLRAGPSLAGPWWPGPPGRAGEAGWRRL